VSQLEIMSNFAYKELLFIGNTFIFNVINIEIFKKTKRNKKLEI